MSGWVTVDTHELAVLAGLLDAGAAAMAVAGPREVNSAAERTAEKARGIAGGYPHGTGALAADVNVEGEGLEAQVFTGQREGFYLEVGSPNTGAPRPWLTGPAEEESDDLAEQLGLAGALW